ncbi:hypothetical protein AL1_27810 [Alistipes shahii WAL 8301]|uniref:Uncharacterized protein n=1 Tax=Alistipes shahii WAL 8301 TaxID=717959 RepID=D4IPR0_9BACT|nr:hypothetical protein AL1_27810 [Alistipes shahii WAL 8301]
MPHTTAKAAAWGVFTASGRGFAAVGGVL